MGNNRLIPLFAQGAEDDGSYKFLQDVERLERLIYDKRSIAFSPQKHVHKGNPAQMDISDHIVYGIQNRKITRGFAIIVTNESAYWKGQKKPDPLCANFFRVNHAQPIHGERYVKALINSGTFGGICITNKFKRAKIRSNWET